MSNSDTKLTEVAQVDVQSAWASKINWGELVKVGCALAAVKGINVPVDVQNDILLTIISVGGLYTWIVKTWFTKTITSASASSPSVPTSMVIKVLLVAFVLSLFLPARSFAADVAPAKAAPASFLTGAYPYDNSGFFVGLFTEGTGGSVAASVPGVNSSSLTTTTAAIGLTAGYAWGTKGSPIAYTIEGDLKLQNFNGTNAGLSLQGPMGFAVRGLVFAPWDRLFGSLAIVNPFGAVPPFAPLQPGVTASNLQVGVGLELAFNDVSLSYLGVPANKVWAFEPKLDFVQMQQLSNGVAVRTFEKIGFPDKGAIIGYRGARAVQGPDITFGLGAYF